MTAAPISLPVASVPTDAGPGLRLFFVEDNAMIRVNLAAALREMVGITLVGHADTEEQACAWLARHAAAWDLAIVDLFLRHGSGFGVLEACRGRDRRRKIAVLTNFADVEVRRRCSALGADAVFDKSADLDLLLAYCLAMRAGYA